MFLRAVSKPVAREKHDILFAPMTGIEWVVVCTIPVVNGTHVAVQKGLVIAAHIAIGKWTRVLWRACSAQMFFQRSSAPKIYLFTAKRTCVDGILIG